MDVNMKMPDLATNEGVELGITRWLANVGDAVKRGTSSSACVSAAAWVQPDSSSCDDAPLCLT